MVLRVQKLDRISLLSTPPHFELDNNPPLQAIDSILGTRVPDNLPLSLQTILLKNIQEKRGRNRDKRLLDKLALWC